MRKVGFHSEAFEQFTDWAKQDSQVFERLTRWSRKITDEHRLVYKVTTDMIIIASCRYHY